jgi:hypothetical protein
LIRRFNPSAQPPEAERNGCRVKPGHDEGVLDRGRVAFASWLTATASALLRLCKQAYFL